MSIPPSSAIFPTVLLVESDPAVQSALRMALEQGKMHVLEAGDVQEAVSSWNLHFQKIQLLVVEINLPQTEGLRLALRLRAERPTLPVLFVGDAIEAGTSAMEANVAFLQKPFGSREFLQQVHGLLGIKNRV